MWSGGGNKTVTLGHARGGDDGVREGLPNFAAMKPSVPLLETHVAEHGVQLVGEVPEAQPVLSEGCGPFRMRLSSSYVCGVRGDRVAVPYELFKKPSGNYIVLGPLRQTRIRVRADGGVSTLVQLMAILPHVQHRLPPGNQQLLQNDYSNIDGNKWAAAEIVVGAGSNRRSRAACGVTTSDTAANGLIKGCILWSWSGEDADMWAAAGIVADGATCIFTLAAATVVVVHHARQQQHEPVYSLVS